MKTEPRRFAVIALLGLAAAALATSAQAPPAAEGPAPGPKPLIRMEYLKPRALPTSAPKRDIFSPGGYAAPVLPGRMIDGAAAPGTAEAAAAAAAAETPPAPALNLRFVGYSLNPAQKRIVGLVLLDGIASAVVEGETLVNGFKIIRITRRELEVQGPDGKSLTFALEGGER